MRLALAGICVIALIPSKRLAAVRRKWFRFVSAVPRTSTLSPYNLLKLAAYKLSVVTVARETEVKWFSHNEDIFIKRVALREVPEETSRLGPVAWEQE